MVFDSEFASTYKRFGHHSEHGGTGDHPDGGPDGHRLQLTSTQCMYLIRYMFCQLTLQYKYMNLLKIIHEYTSSYFIFQNE